MFNRTYLEIIFYSSVHSPYKLLNCLQKPAAFHRIPPKLMQGLASSVLQTPQTLDSDKSGGLDSQEFCAAIRKLVFARSLFGSNTYSSAYENTYANTYSSAHSKPAIVSAFLLLMSLPTHYFLIIWWTDVSGIAKVCVQHCVSAPAPRSTLPRRSLFFSKQCSSFGFPLGGSQVIHEQTRSLQLRNHTLCSLLPRF